MRERDIDYIIEAQNPEEKQALYEKLKSRLNLPDTPQQRPKKKLSMPWKLSIAAVLVVVVCLAITLPIVLRDDGNSERYCYASDCVETKLDYTIKDYAAQTNKQLLYVDWYDVSEETLTYLYTESDHADDMVYLKEMLLNGETGDVIYLYLSDRYTQVDILDLYPEACTNEFNVNNVQIKWCCNAQDSLAIFEYQGYKYYLKILEGNREDLIKEIVEGMLK